MNATAHAGGALEDHATSKLELAAILRSLLHVAERRHDELSVAECRRILARLAEDRFNLAILGQFSRGKSSLINALLGEEALPTGILPLTSVITTVTYGEVKKVLLQREGWAFAQEIQLDQLAEFVTQTGNPGNEKRVTLAEIQLPNELLRLGVRFVDTPGVASTIRANSQTTRQYLPEADAAILVTSFESPLTEAELKFLAEIRVHVRKVFVVVNKQDLVAAAKRGPVLASLRETLSTAFEGAGFDLFALSARDALRAKQDRSTETLSASGMPILETALAEFLHNGKARELLLRAADRAAASARSQETAIRISERSRGPEEAAIFAQRLRERFATLACERELLIERMGNSLPILFSNSCEQAVALWSSDAEAKVASDLRDWFLRDQDDIGDQPIENFLGSLAQQHFSEWVSLHRQELEDLLHQLIQPETSIIEDLASKISKIPRDVLGAEYPGEPVLPDPIDFPPLAFREIQIPLSTFAAPWWSDLVPAGRPRQLFARRWLKRIPEFVRLYLIGARSVFEAVARDWISSLDEKLTDLAKTTSSHVTELLRQEPVSADLPEVRNLLDRIQTFAASVARLKPEDAEIPHAISSGKAISGTRSASRCSICLRLERALWNFLAVNQYDLSVNEADQKRHANRSGFCPLHTWQYEAVASPQGVCSAYPEVLKLFASKLRRLAEDESSVDAIKERLRSMLPRQMSCAACELMAAEEKTAATELVRRLGAENSTPLPLCALHLCTVLEAQPDLKLAKRLVLEEAGAFETLAEDMQNYVLNYMAIRQQLSTTAENNAAFMGLSRLVGSQRIVAPWRVE